MDKSQLIITLNVKELKELIREVVAESVQIKLPMCSSEESDIIFIEKAAEITRLSKHTLYSKVSKGEIPVLSRGKPLRFSKKAVIKWLQNGNLGSNGKCENLFPYRKTNQ